MKSTGHNEIERDGRWDAAYEVGDTAKRIK
jgi:hypothetical protein